MPDQEASDEDMSPPLPAWGADPEVGPAPTLLPRVQHPFSSSSRPTLLAPGRLGELELVIFLTPLTLGASPSRSPRPFATMAKKSAIAVLLVGVSLGLLVAVALISNRRLGASSSI